MNRAQLFRSKAARSAAVVTVLCLAALPASAHRVWLLPSSTVLSGGEAWVTVDAAVSNTLFVFEHRPLRLDGLTVRGPGGRQLSPQNLHTGQFRSSFDLRLDAPGTYRISIANSSVMASWRENGEVKRWRGPAAELAANTPAGAEQLTVNRNDMRVETFVTLGKPDRGALAPIGQGLEIIPETHPADLTAGEEAVFQVLIDGSPAADTEVTVALGAGRHVDRPFEQKLHSGADGRFLVRFPSPGFYWMQATTGTGSPQQAGRRATCVLTVEVLPQ
jgi:hypothetical protein